MANANASDSRLDRVIALKDEFSRCGDLLIELESYAETLGWLASDDVPELFKISTAMQFVLRRQVERLRSSFEVLELGSREVLSELALEVASRSKGESAKGGSIASSPVDLTT